MSDQGRTGRFDRGDVLALAAVLAAGVVIPGLLRWGLGRVGYDTLGTVVFVLGYAAMVLVVWWRWIRPLDLVGPSGDAESDERG